MLLSRALTRLTPLRSSVTSTLRSRRSSSRSAQTEQLWSAGQKLGTFFLRSLGRTSVMLRKRSAAFLGGPKLPLQAPKREIVQYGGLTGQPCYWLGISRVRKGSIGSSDRD